MGEKTHVHELEVNAIVNLFTPLLKNQIMLEETPFLFISGSQSVDDKCL